jgi:hypothetical protein
MKLSLLVPVTLAACATASAAPKADSPKSQPASGTQIVSADPAVDAKIDADGNVTAHMKNAASLFSEPCRSPYHLQVKDGDKWTDVMVDLPAKGNYWLDGQHHGYGMCDVSPCGQAMGNDFGARLQGYRQTGTKDDGPVLERYEVKGTIKVTFAYSTTPQCEYKTFDVIVNRP